VKAGKTGVAIQDIQGDGLLGQDWRSDAGGQADSAHDAFEKFHANSLQVVKKENPFT
jgi:hypothetical protein